MHATIGRWISILHRQSQIYINQVLKEFNITSAEYSFLLYLYRNDGITQDDLSTYLYIDKAATTRAIKSLELKGYITRMKDPDDKRCNRVYLTTKSKDYQSEIKRRVSHWSELITEGMDQGTIDIVHNTLSEMVKKVEEMNLRKDMEEE
ncbi:MAG: hypothetical protein K0S47_112 [Herbinix sp.]|jgi:DNA-binding MarR family transcriptional regulator|nr:hypothetical protein [Herbinix sp.]